jgi:hypothetical protein
MINKLYTKEVFYKDFISLLNQYKTIIITRYIIY